MTRWEHLTQVPDPLRTTMLAEFIQWKKKDLGIETIIDCMYNDPSVARNMVKSNIVANNPIRIHGLCRTVKAAHPTESIRNIFIAVALFTGVSERWVRELYYRGMQCSK